MSIYRELIRHSAVYSVGQILYRVASLLLLPLYTKYLTPADYGVMTILDLTRDILGYFAAAGVINAATRYYHDPAYADSRHDCWTTGLVFLMVICIPQMVLAYLLRSPLALITIRDGSPEGSLLVALTILNLLVSVFFNYCASYLRVEKRSVLFVCLTIPDLIARVSLNILFIAHLRMGILGFLYSGLIVGGVQSVVLITLLFAGRRFRIRRELFRPFFAYGWPFVISGLASLAMHQANRYFLLWFGNDKAQVGLFSVAFNMAQAANQFLIQPFFSIWFTMAFEINTLPDRLQVFHRVFKYFVLGIGLVLLLVALLSTALVRALTQPNYYEIANVLPILCLAFLFFPLHVFFSLPALLYNKTQAVAANCLVAAGATLVLNFILVPTLGMYGAAIASIGTYVVYSFAGYRAYRRIENLRFPVRFVGFIAGAGVVTYLIYRLVVPSSAPFWVLVVVPLAAWSLIVALVMAGPARALIDSDSHLRKWLSRRKAARGSSKPAPRTGNQEKLSRAGAAPAEEPAPPTGSEREPPARETPIAAPAASVLEQAGVERRHDVPHAILPHDEGKVVPRCAVGDQLNVERKLGSHPKN